MPNNRREREEALIREGRLLYAHEEIVPGFFRHGDNVGLDLCDALETAYRREDAIRALPSWTHTDCPHNDVRARTLAEVRAILDRENA